MKPTIQDPIAALRAVVESHQRYTELTGRELDCIALHPDHCRQILALADIRVVNISRPPTKFEHKTFHTWAAEKMGLTIGHLHRPANCQHTVTSKFTSTGEVYCHDCRQTFAGDTEKHRRSSTIENS